MNKIELRDELIGNGYTVDIADNWSLVSNVQEVRKYDVKAEKAGDFFVGQVKVINEGKANETATVLSGLKAKSGFIDDLKTFTLLKEAEPVYAIVTKEVFSSDEFAIVDVYALSNGKITKKVYGVRRRNGAFDFKEII